MELGKIMICLKPLPNGNWEASVVDHCGSYVGLGPSPGIALSDLKSEITTKEWLHISHTEWMKEQVLEE